MTRDEMDAAIRKIFEINPAVPVVDEDRVIFIAGMRAAADLIPLKEINSLEEIVHRIRVIAANLEKTS